MEWIDVLNGLILFGQILTYGFFGGLPLCLAIRELWRHFGP